MINLQEIEETIAELEAGKTTMTVCSRLADLYAVRDKLRGNNMPQSYAIDYSLAAAPPKASALPDTYNMYVDSEFLEAVEGKDPDAVWHVIDGHMENMRALNPKVYENILQRIRQL